VELKHSKSGTCEFRTACKHYAKFANLEFNFICQSADGENVEHVFDNDGGIPRAGVYDSKQKCAKCLTVTPDHSLVSRDDGDDAATSSDADADSSDTDADTASTVADTDAASTDAASLDTDAASSDADSDKASSDADTEAESSAADAETTKAPTTTEPATGPPVTAAFYGPNGCIAAYRNSAGSCVMQTNSCPIDDMGDYDFGFTCVDDKGASERHLMGSGSFSKAETFDTLVKCSLCLGLDNDSVEAPKARAIADDVASIKDGMKDLKSAIKTINNHIEEEKIPDASASDDAESDDAEEKKSFLRARKTKGKHPHKDHGTVQLSEFKKPKGMHKRYHSSKRHN